MSTPARDALSYQGPGDLTLTSIVLFTLGAYGVAAGAATGEEAVVAVGVFAFALFFAGIVWPIVVLARVRVDVVSPPDAIVGEEIDLRVHVQGGARRVELRVLDPPGQWWQTPVPVDGTVPHLATRRGVFQMVRVQVRTSVPLGVFVRTRTLRVTLPAPVTVAPKPANARPVLLALPDDQPTAPASIPQRGSGDAVRSVRPYVPGDPARFVHWPTSARRGDLVVREHEPPPAMGVALVVDLRADDPEAIASRAAGIGIATLAAGGIVWCCTCERDGPVSDLVVDARDLGRRLARAVPGAPATAPEHWPVEVVS